MQRCRHPAAALLERWTLVLLALVAGGCDFSVHPAIEGFDVHNPCLPTPLCAPGALCVPPAPSPAACDAGVGYGSDRANYAAALANAATSVGSPGDPFPLKHEVHDVLICRRDVVNRQAVAMKSCQAYFTWSTADVWQACGTQSLDPGVCSTDDVAAACLHKGYPPWFIYYYDKQPPAELAVACTENAGTVWWTAL